MSKPRELNLRCIHRHTIKEHPGCFKNGLVRWESPKQFERFSGKAWYQYPGYKIGYFDIETDNLNADFGTILSWAIKEKGGDTVYSVITKDELFSGQYDRRLIEEFVQKISEFSILVGYNCVNFDMPMMRAKAMHYNIPFPGHGDLYQWDLYFTVKSKLRISRKSLANVCQYLGIQGKTEVDKDIWRAAKYGDSAALDYVVSHNIADVEITEKLHDRIEFTRKWIKTSI